MKLAKIQHNYNAVFSLGNQCFVAEKLRDYNLRPYSGVIDWMISSSLNDVTLLLQNKFTNFMEKEYMRFEDYHVSGKKIILVDTLYNIKSVHDFLTTENTPTNWNSYTNFKMKIEKRIQRFLDKLETCPMILFVRIGGTYEEAKLLEEVLSELVTHEFRVLLLNGIMERTILEYDWDLKYTCSLGIPMDGNENKEIWDQILKGVICKE
ncbi:hypothetical protein BN2127_JRS10_02108 [Bacillus subtilis]|nr:hypothetical protein BN2127_JRS10_02108 [Bacillus subtilis]